MVETDPSDLPLEITYDGSATAPTAPGSYAVVATIANAVYTGSATGTLTILPPPKPTASLSASLVEGPVPLTVEFTNSSSGYIVYSFLETFNSDAEIVVDPTTVDVLFDEPGTYEVKLTAKGIGGSDEASVSVTVHGHPDLSAERLSVTALEDQVAVVDLSPLDTQTGSWSVVEAESADVVAGAALSQNELRLTPVADVAGTETIAVVRTNDYGLQTSLRIEVTWLPVDDPPRIDPTFAPRTEAPEDVAIRLEPNRHLVDIDTDHTQLEWQVSGFDQELVATFEISPQGMVIVPMPESAGETEAVITVTDPATGQSATQQIRLVWTAVDDIPNPASPVFPATGSSAVPFSPTLEWSPQLVDGQPVEYDVYFGPASQKLQVRAAGLRETQWKPGLLEASTLYFWKVVTRSAAGMESTGSFAFFTREPLRDSEGEIRGLLNGDRVVDFDDFFLFVDRFGAESGAPDYNSAFDLNRDGRIDLADFFIFADNFGRSALIL